MLSGTFLPDGTRIMKSYRTDRERLEHTIGVVKTYARFCEGEEREDVDKCVVTLQMVLGEIQPLSKEKP